MISEEYIKLEFKGIFDPNLPQVPDLDLELVKAVNINNLDQIEMLSRELCCLQSIELDSFSENFDYL